MSRVSEDKKVRYNKNIAYEAGKNYGEKKNSYREDKEHGKQYKKADNKSGKNYNDAGKGSSVYKKNSNNHKENNSGGKKNNTGSVKVRAGIRERDISNRNNNGIGKKDKEILQGAADIKEKKVSKCPVSSKCGGCQYIDLPYEKQLAMKQKAVNELIGKYVKVDKIIGMDNPYHYRNKVHAVLDVDRGRIISGVYEAKTHRVVPVKNCLIENETASEIIRTIVSLMPSFKIKAYNEDTGYGYLRHILIRVGHKTGQVMVVLVAADAVFPSKNNFIKALREKHPEITTVVLNINNKNTSMVLGEREIVLYGRGYIEDELCGKRFNISPKSFYQVNSVQTEKLYSKAIEFAGLTGKERVIDAYCGIGTIGITAADNAGEVIGVELNSDAVKDAVKNAKLNNTKNITFYKNDAGEFMQNMAAAGERADVVIMDPPRSGSDEKFIDAVAVLKPEKVVYISCGPDTLARDLEYFRKKGYKAVKAVPVDMFGMTVHCEIVCYIQRVK